MNLECAFISGACNAVYNGMDYCQFEPNTHLIAYPCSNQVLIYDTNAIRIISSFSNFNARVNSVKFLDSDTILSGDGEGKVTIFNSKSILHQAKMSGSIETMKVIDKFIILLQNDGVISVLGFDLKVVSQTKFGNNVMEAIDAIQYDKMILVALSGVDNGIHFYILTEEGNLEFKTTVKGHVRSVNDLKFQPFGEEEMHLASGAKDNFVRIWKIYRSAHQEAKIKRFKVNDQGYSIKLESILQGHNEEVSSLCWKNESTLASGSFDYNVIIWTQDKETQLWLSSNRLGQSAGNKNQIFGIQYSKDRQSLCGYTLIGAFYLWDKDYRECSTITGHYDEVSDLDFRDYLVTCSKDQTTRIFSKWVEKNTYHEVSRPQIHGYDLKTVRLLGQKNIISGAEEKILRIFSPSPFTANQLAYLSGIQMDLNAQAFEVQHQGRKIKEYKVSAETVQQPLGLMNVQFEEEDDEKFDQQEDTYNPTITYGTPPSDALITAKSLWPEVNKLYGHGYAIQAVDTYGHIAASSSIAITEEAAQIIIWNTETLQILQQLKCHSYTVMQLRFSKSGKYLASVSKDRSLAIHVVVDGKYQLLFKSEPCSRIVYCCAFTGDESGILTGSRDKKIRLYDIQSQQCKEFAMHASVTALDCVTTTQGRRLVGAGFADGEIKVFELAKEELREVCVVGERFRHSKGVNRLMFRDNEIATCSEDHTVRIFRMN